MFEALESGGSASISTAITRQGCYLPDDHSTNSSHDCERYPTQEGRHHKYLPNQQYNAYHPTDVVEPPYFTNKEILQSHPFSIPNHDQQLMRQSNGQIKYESCDTDDYGYHHHPSTRTYSITNAAYPVTNPYGLDGQHWEIGTFSEPTNGLHNVLSSISTSHEKANQIAELTTNGAQKSQPYAQLIHLALLSVPDHKMVLKDIYKWFKKNTDKAQSGTTGWQNSIRHNLSMNIAFQKEEADDPTNQGKKSYVWALSQDALEKGCVESTTRFRKPLNRKASHTQQTYRVSKPSSISTAGSLLHPHHQLSIRNALWSNEMLRARHSLDSGELQTPYSQQPAWQGQLSLGSLPSRTNTQSGQLAEHQLPQHEGRELVPTSDNHDAYEQGRSPPISSESTMAYLRSSRYGEIAFPIEHAVAERISPCPSMTITNSSYGRPELTDDERYQFFHYPELQIDTKYAREQDYDRIYAWRAHPLGN